MEDINDRKWEILSTEYLIRRPWLTARRDHVKLPTGVENPEFYVLEYPDWVNVIAITKEGEFVMIRQYRHGLGETRYELCAGVSEEGEDPVESARRELYEETGYGGGEWQLWMTISANPSTTTTLPIATLPQVWSACLRSTSKRPRTSPYTCSRRQKSRNCL